MACAQATLSAETYHEKNKSVVNEIKSKAQSLCTQKSLTQIQGAMTAGVIRNIGGQLLLNWSCDIHGHPVMPFPHQITEQGEFVHAADPGFGQMDSGAVVYTLGDSAIGLLLAWSVPGVVDCSNKVYVEAGFVGEITKVDEIKKKLEASGSRSLYIDPKTGTEMYAEINPTGCVASLGAIFLPKC